MCAAISLGFAVLPLVVFLGLGEGPHRVTANPAERELASNGLYALFRVFRNNNLDYLQFYATMSDVQVADTLTDELSEGHLSQVRIAPGMAYERDVRPEGKIVRKNIVLISVESLGSDYVEAFGGHPGLTPNISRIAGQSPTFHQVNATGLRTVRGLEALTLSLPPTPGRAVPIHVKNRGLASLGPEQAQRGYDTLYLYGGYSFFDNMNDFFSGAGYTMIDRSDIDSAKIHHETIWGVADEDLFNKALEEFDLRGRYGRRFFAHIMTTSNHRPYTYPEGRIDIPSRTGRDGAVKYTDWAIGKFMKEAEAKPWFRDTLFVIVANHTSHGRGRTDLPPENYRITLLIYGPGLHQAGPGRLRRLVDRRRAHRARCAQHSLPVEILRSGYPARRSIPPARLHGQLPDGRLHGERAGRRTRAAAPGAGRARFRRQGGAGRRPGRGALQTRSD